MMTKKDYIRAAAIIQSYARGVRSPTIDFMIDLFVRFFRGDNSSFDEIRFREACLAFDKCLIGEMKKRKARPARLDSDKSAKPLTEIRAVVKAGNKLRDADVLEYVVRDTDPHK